MLYSFEGQLISEGNRSFIRIPFNIWEETGLRAKLLARGQRSWRPWTIMESAIRIKWFTLKETMYACQSAVLHILMAALISGIKDGSMVLQ